DETAKKCLSRGECDDRADEGVPHNQQKAHEQQDRGDFTSETAGWRGLLTRRVRPGLVVGIGLAILQQIVGINTVLYFAPTVMEQTALSASNSIVYSVIIGVVNLGMT